MLLAEAVGPAGHITGLDLSAEFLGYAEEIVAEAGLGSQMNAWPRSEIFGQRAELYCGMDPISIRTGGSGSRAGNKEHAWKT
jgi:hypothetical protein